MLAGFEVIDPDFAAAHSKMNPNGALEMWLQSCLYPGKMHPHMLEGIRGMTPL